MAGFGDQPVITFAVKPHENGDRLLLVQLPDRASPGPGSAGTAGHDRFKTDSPEELLFKQAIKGMPRFASSWSSNSPLLRTNAPAQKGNRATILDLDLDKMINTMDEPRVRRMMGPGSLQEVLWQVGDMPGAIVPVDREIFLEFEPERAAAADARAAPCPPLRRRPTPRSISRPCSVANGALEIGPARQHHEQSRLRQPAVFHARQPQRAVHLGPVARAGTTQTDIYRYDITPRHDRAGDQHAGERVLADGHAVGESVGHPRRARRAKTQRLWQFTVDGRDPRPVLENVKPVGYHAWGDDRTLALFVLGPARRRCSSPTRGTGTAVVLASDIGRSIQRIPGPASAIAQSASSSASAAPTA